VTRRSDPNARLVYSTGADAPDETDAKKPARPPAKALSGGGAGIRLRLERRASDRVVTLVTGLPGSDEDRSELARSLKSACGTGGTVKGGVLELQGDHRDAVEAALRARGLKSKRAGG
jgi:translation initiation factor 1